MRSDDELKEEIRRLESVIKRDVERVQSLAITALVLSSGDKYIEQIREIISVHREHSGALQALKWVVSRKDAMRPTWFLMSDEAVSKVAE